MLIQVKTFTYTLEIFENNGLILNICSIKHLQLRKKKIKKGTPIAKMFFPWFELILNFLKKKEMFHLPFFTLYFHRENVSFPNSFGFSSEKLSDITYNLH